MDKSSGVTGTEGVVSLSTVANKANIVIFDSDSGE